MTEEVEFLFDNELIFEIEKLIRNSKSYLLLISPFIDLDPRIKTALQEKKELPNFRLEVLFGKNEDNYLKSIKKDSLDFLKEFPNVEIRYNERLHAKFYQNDFNYIMTSLNLYNYSLANNIEVGVKGEFKLGGLLGNTLNATFSVIETGVDLVKQDVLGMTKKESPVVKFRKIYELSDIKYKTKAVIEEKTGIVGLLGKKKLGGFNVLINNLDKETSSVQSNKVNQIPEATTDINVSVSTVVNQTVNIKYMSASSIAKKVGLQTKEVVTKMEKLGFIKDDQITQLGKTKRLVIKNYMGNDYVAYPDNLEELSSLNE